MGADSSFGKQTTISLIYRGHDHALGLHSLVAYRGAEVATMTSRSVESFPAQLRIPYAIKTDGTKDIMAVIDNPILGSRVMGMVAKRVQLEAVVLVFPCLAHAGQ